ncbi:MAG TPA: M48 family metallopeptidase [Candidatus Baltobacteraceae bacterium]|nr:M48 family metallopeptidase [Candidatus Baltobacteraceae bacterium]
MNARKFCLGLLAGMGAGYVAIRTVQALARRDTAPRKPSHDSAAYGKARRALAVAGAIRSTLSSVAFAYGPLAPRIARAFEPLPRWLRPGAFVAVVGIGSSLLELPVSIVEDYEIERRYGLTDQSERAFLSDLAKSSALMIVVMSGLAMLGGIALRRFRRTWPLVAAIGMFPLFVLANLIVPVYILPLFNRFEPLQGPLERRLRALAARFGVGDADILRMDMSRQTKKANAFVAGIGSTHRIVLGDTLVDAFEPREIEFVVAHELGHYVSRDTWRMIALAEALTAGLLGLTAIGLRRDDTDESIRLLRIAAWLGIGMLAARPAVNAFSRSREWAADRFAVDVTGAPRDGIAAFRRLRDQNLAEEELPPWYEFLFASHPSLGKRIGALESAEPSTAAAP